MGWLGALRSGARSSSGPGSELPGSDERQAAWIVFSALGHPLVFPHDDTALARSELLQLSRLAGVSPSLRRIHPQIRRDAVGWSHLPAAAVVELARRAAGRNRSEVAGYLRLLEARSLYRIRTGEISREDCESQMVAAALVREWTAPRARKSELDKENLRLRSLIATAAEELEQLGRFRSADQLRSALD